MTKNKEQSRLEISQITDSRYIYIFFDQKLAKQYHMVDIADLSYIGSSRPDACRCAPSGGHGGCSLSLRYQIWTLVFVRSLDSKESWIGKEEPLVVWLGRWGKSEATEGGCVSMVIKNNDYGRLLWFYLIMVFESNSWFVLCWLRIQLWLTNSGISYLLI